jgi:hypothetical protein
VQECKGIKDEPCRIRAGMHPLIDLVLVKKEGPRLGLSFYSET